MRHHSLASLSSLLLDLAAKRKQSNKERILFRFCNFFYKLRPPAVKRQQCNAVVAAAAAYVLPNYDDGK